LAAPLAGLAGTAQQPGRTWRSSRGSGPHRAGSPTPRSGTCRRTGLSALRRGSPAARRRSARAAGPGHGADPGAGAVATVVAGLRDAERVTGGPHPQARGEFGHGRLAHVVDPLPGSALSGIVSKSACSFAGSPPRTGPWPVPAPVAPSPGGRSAQLAGRAACVRAAPLTRPAASRDRRQ